MGYLVLESPFFLMWKANHLKRHHGTLIFKRRTRTYQPTMSSYRNNRNITFFW
ncbi:hypothetical protein THIOM_003021 [Candidatus Thiomargarita nelsonii]|uniref:Uncharacterized protein n=1 Tax=Candidatus Thiomargarita nelsonii TaxID=1003181 RepID=A0A176RZY1_9GAMM|nr:hypothetical protein THIOM_003021 [Candidatus Thiomargarita nelsonii]